MIELIYFLVPSSPSRFLTMPSLALISVGGGVGVPGAEEGPSAQNENSDTSKKFSCEQRC